MIGSRVQSTRNRKTKSLMKVEAHAQQKKETRIAQPKKKKATSKGLNSARNLAQPLIMIDRNDKGQMSTLEQINKHLENLMRPLDQISKDYNTIQAPASKYHAKKEESHSKSVRTPKPKTIERQESEPAIDIPQQLQAQPLDRQHKPELEIDQIMTRYQQMCKNLDLDLKDAAQKIKRDPKPDLKLPTVAITSNEYQPVSSIASCNMFDSKFTDKFQFRSHDSREDKL